MTGSVVRQALKAVVFAAAIILVSPLILLCWLERLVSANAELVFSTSSQAVALIPGPVGSSLRAAFYFATLEHCSWETKIGFGSVIVHRGARLSRYVSTGAFCVIGHATIEPGVRLASRVSIPSGKRQHLDEMGRLSGVTQYDRVRIGTDTWVGEAAVVMADVGSRVIVSAGAVVLNAVPDECVVGGNPAKIIKKLDPAHHARRES